MTSRFSGMLQGDCREFQIGLLPESSAIEFDTLSAMQKVLIFEKRKFNARNSSRSRYPKTGRQLEGLVYGSDIAYPFFCSVHRGRSFVFKNQ